MSEYAQKIQSLEQQRRELVNQIDAIGLASMDNINAERKAVIRIDEAFDEQKRLIRNIKLVITTILMIFAMGFWYSEHYFLSILCAGGILCFDIFWGQDFKDFNAHKRMALMDDVERRMNGI